VESQEKEGAGLRSLEQKLVRKAEAGSPSAFAQLFDAEIIGGECVYSIVVDDLLKVREWNLCLPAVR